MKITRVTITGADDLVSHRELAEWATKVWNFVRGCRRVSPGCGGPKGEGGCYAEKTAYRFSGPGMPYEGLVTMGANGPRWTGKGLFVPEKLSEPLRVRKPDDGSRHRFFVNSMSDLFFEEFSNEQIAAGFGVMAACPQHDFLILTKRIRRALDWFAWVERQETTLLTIPRSPKLICAGHAQNATGLHWTVPLPRVWPLPNVWIGVSVEDQKAADERIPDLLRVPAAVRFISAEPLLGPVDLRKYLNVGGICECDQKSPPGARCEGKGRNGWIRCSAGCRRLDWVIAGGESGNGARPCDVEWLESLVLQCREQLGMGIKPWPVPCFVKQLGAVPFDSRESDRCTDEPHPGGAAADPSCRLNLNDRKGGDMSEWPESLRVRQFPEARA